MTLAKISLYCILKTGQSCNAIPCFFLKIPNKMSYYAMNFKIYLQPSFKAIAGKGKKRGEQKFEYLESEVSFLDKLHFS